MTDSRSIHLTTNKKLKIELPYDSAIPLLGIYPEKTIIQKESCTTMFIAALFTMARTWKQPNVHRRRIKKMWHIYTMEYYSAIKSPKFFDQVSGWMVEPSAEEESIHGLSGVH